MDANENFYSPTTFESIPKTLASLLPQGEDSTLFNRSVSNNILFLVATNKGLEEAEQQIQILAMLHPGRFFVFNSSFKGTSATSEVSARCHKVSEKEHVCCECIKINYSESILEAVPSVLQANFVTGASIDLFIFDAEVPPAVLETFGPLVDTAYIDSSQFSKELDKLSALLKTVPSLVDMAWLRLSSWRESLRLAFDKNPTKKIIDSLREIKFEVGSDDHIDFNALLLAGFLISKLGLHIKKEKNFFLCRNSSWKESRLLFSKSSGQGLKRLKITGENGSVVLDRRNNVLHTEVDGDVKVTYSVPLDDDSLDGCLTRYFGVGESMVNYRSSLKGALQLAR